MTAKTDKTATPARTSADGKTVLEVGAKVKSTKDGLTGEVIGLDKSDRYVRVLFSDGKKRVRSTATLAPVKSRATKKTAAAASE